MDMTTEVAAKLGPLGILAGGGGLPEQIAASAVAQGRAVHIVAIMGEAAPGIEKFPHTWVNWGSIGRMSASLKSAGCRDLIIVGSVTRPDLRKVRPDLGLIRAIPTIIRLFGGGDDHVLRNVVRFFEAQGFIVRGVAEVAPHLLMATGAIGRNVPDPAIAADIDRGFALVDALGFADVGQAVVIKGGRVLAIEAAEGTDRMLVRLGAEKRAQGAILIKRPKPDQELRVDMPAIGPRTVELAAEIGLVGIVVEAGRVLIAERAGVIEAADRCGLFVAGVVAHTAPTLVRPVGAFKLVNRLMPQAPLRQDTIRACGVVAALASFASTAGVVVVRNHVIAIETGEGLEAMFARVNVLRQWGAKAGSKRRGVLALSGAGLTASSVATIVTAAAKAGLAGLVLPSGIATNVADQFGQVAERQGLSVTEVHDSGRLGTL